MAEKSASARARRHSDGTGQRAPQVGGTCRGSRRKAWGRAPGAGGRGRGRGGAGAGAVPVLWGPVLRLLVLRPLHLGSRVFVSVPPHPSADVRAPARGRGSRLVPRSGRPAVRRAGHRPLTRPQVTISPTGSIPVVHQVRSSLLSVPRAHRPASPLRCPSAAGVPPECPRARP